VTPPEASRHDAAVLKVYVASGSTEADRASRWIEALRAAGVLVTYDWTPAVLSAGCSPTDAADHRSPAIAQAEIAAVLSADLIWFLTPKKGSTGGGFEVGIAYATGRPIVCSGPHMGVFHFGSLLLEIERDEDVFEWIVAASKRSSDAIRARETLPPPGVFA
jgi:hypothetical protein